MLLSSLRRLDVLLLCSSLSRTPMSVRPTCRAVRRCVAGETTEWALQQHRLLSGRPPPPPFNPLHPSTPPLTPLAVLAGNRCLVLASDGLWDVLQNDEAVALALQHAARGGGGGGAEAAARALVQEAFVRGSMDNISVVVVLFTLKAD